MNFRKTPSKFCILDASVKVVSKLFFVNHAHESGGYCGVLMGAASNGRAFRKCESGLFLKNRRCLPVLGLEFKNLKTLQQ